MVSSDPTDAHGNLFPIFLLGLIQFFLAPITVWRVGSWLYDCVYGGEDKKASEAALSAASQAIDQSTEWGKAAAAKAARNKPTLMRKVKSQLSGFNLWLWIFWGISALLVLYIALSQVEEVEHFDPYKVLNVKVGADAAAIKKAYRSLSLQYHPDKNPDPEAHKFFTESITPAYKTLTDETARANFEKYGHPDGKQAPKLGVALPQWMFGKDGTGPIVLITLVTLFIVGPLFLAVITITQLNKYSGSNGVLRQTQYYFRAELRPNMGLSKVARVLSVAEEYIKMPFKRDQEEPVRKLLATFKNEYDAKDPKFLKRHPSILRAHMLLLAQACRKTTEVDPALQADLKTVVKTFPVLFEEALKIVRAPVNNMGFSLYLPLVAFLEFSQCVTQAVAPSARKNGGKNNDDFTSLLQLPHVDEAIALALTRKKVRSVAELSALAGEDARAAALTAAGLSAAQAKDVERHLAFVPRAEVSDVTVDSLAGDEIAEMDVLSLTCRVKLCRGAAAKSSEEDASEPKPGVGPGGVEVNSKDDLPVLPFCQHIDREEGWWLIVADPATNFVLGHKRLPAEAVAEAQRAPEGFLAQIKFPVPAAGSYALSVMIVSDYWIGADVRFPHKIKVLKRTKEMEEAREAKKLAESAKQKRAAREDGEIADGEDRGDDESDDESDDDEEEQIDESHPDYGYGGEYPSEETGTEESTDEETERRAEEFRLRREAARAQLVKDAEKMEKEKAEAEAGSEKKPSVVIKPGGNAPVRLGTPKTSVVPRAAEKVGEGATNAGESAKPAESAN